MSFFNCITVHRAVDKNTDASCVLFNFFFDLQPKKVADLLHIIYIVKTGAVQNNENIYRSLYENAKAIFRFR